MSIRVILGVAIVSAGLAQPVYAQGFFGKLKSMLGGDAASTAASVLSNDDMISGLKEALRVGADNVVGQLGSADGFWGDEAIRIAMPGPLQKVDETLTRFGMGSLTNSVKERMNRAAEAAVPEAKELFVSAISDMTITDAANILKGSDTAATDYFREKMSPQLRERMAPIITTQLDNVGAISAAENAVKKMPFGSMVPNLQEEVTGHVLDGAVDGVFYYLAKEEAAIRANPAARTTDILKKVFGAAL